MNSETTFTIDGSLGPVDADHALEQLGHWLASGADGTLDIAPLPPAPELPTQTALQLLFAAATELTGRGEIRDRLSPAALALCATLPGDGPLSELAGAQIPEAENV